MRSFELARGYAPSPSIMRKSIATKKYLDAHMKRQAERSLQRIMHAKIYNTGAREHLQEGLVELVY